MRDDFPQKVKDILAKRAGFRCSNPRCRILTIGPQENPKKYISIGNAAHITAASPEGPRYDDNLTPEERISETNGIWLCQNCGKLVDSDTAKFTVEILREWKRLAEEDARYELEVGFGRVESRDIIFRKIEELMPDLLEEMRIDLGNYPLRREFVLLKKEWDYWAKGTELIYFFNEHPELDNKINILINYNLIREITYNNVKRYSLSEDLVEYLKTDK